MMPRRRAPGHEPGHRIGTVELPADVPAPLVDLLTRAAGPAEAGELQHEAAARAAFITAHAEPRPSALPRPRPLGGRVRALRVALATLVAFLVAGGGLAAADVLPAPAQRWVSEALGVVGIDVPSPDEAGGTTDPSAPGTPGTTEPDGQALDPQTGTTGVVVGGAGAATPGAPASDGAARPGATEPAGEADAPVPASSNSSAPRPVTPRASSPAAEAPAAESPGAPSSTRPRPTPPADAGRPTGDRTSGGGTRNRDNDNAAATKGGGNRAGLDAQIPARTSADAPVSGGRSPRS